MLKRIIKRFFYNPVKYIRNKKNISISDSVILLKSCTFRFDGLNKDNLIKIGDDSMVGCSFVFETDQGTVSIGNGCYVAAATTFISRSSISVGDNVTIAWGCTFYDHNSHSLSYQERIKDIKRQNNDFREGRDFIFSKDWSVVKTRPITVSNNVWIGFDSVILAGVTIGEGAIIGARSVVRDDVEPWTVVAGNPAAIIRRLKHD